MEKPSKAEVLAMSQGEFLQYAERFLTPCALCNRAGQPVTQSLEGRGYSYCDDAGDCKRAEQDRR